MRIRIGSLIQSNVDMSRDIPIVFVIDDDISVRESLVRLIRVAGWQPSVCASAEEFLARPRQMTPGCLLAELRLPGLTGLNLQRLILDRTEIPIIFKDRVSGKSKLKLGKQSSNMLKELLKLSLS